MPNRQKPITRAEQVAERLAKSDPRITYGGLLFIHQQRGYSLGWAKHKFREIYGKWPRPIKPVEPLDPHSDLLTWLKAQGRNWGLRKKREEAKAGQVMADLIYGPQDNSKAKKAYARHISRQTHRQANSVAAGKSLGAKALDRVEDCLSQLEATVRAGGNIPDEADREAFEIINGIEQRMAAK